MNNYFCNKTKEIDKKVGVETKKTTFLAQNEFPVPEGRLETMVMMGMDIPALAVRRQLASGIDLMIHLGRLRDKRRVLLEISEITGCRDGEIAVNPLYKFQETSVEESGKICGDWIQVGELFNKEKLFRAGFQDD